MASGSSIALNDAVYKLQLSLLDGIQNEDQLFAAGSLMSRGDYKDVVTERSLANLCGYPLCKNSLPSDGPRVGRYVQKVFDLQDAYMFCSSGCLAGSSAFVKSLHEERCSVLNPSKLNDVLRLFEDLSLDSEGLGKNGDLGLSGLQIQEKVEATVGEVSLEEWMGPSNAIEGYVPQRDRTLEPSVVKNKKKQGGRNGSDPVAGSSGGHGSFVTDMDFTSAVITDNEYCISKGPSDLTGNSSGNKWQEPISKRHHEDLKGESSTMVKRQSVKRSTKSKEKKNDNIKKEAKSQNHTSSSTDSFFSDMNFTSTLIINDEYCISKSPSDLSGISSGKKLQEKKREGHCQDLKGESSATVSHQSGKRLAKSKGKKKDHKNEEAKSQNQPSSMNLSQTSSTWDTAPDRFQSAKASELLLKPSLKASGAKKFGRSVTWADQKDGSAMDTSLCELREMEETEAAFDEGNSNDYMNDGEMLRVKSAEACAVALSKAAEAIATGNADISDVVSESGITILPRPENLDEENILEAGTESLHVTWPSKPGLPRSEFFDPEDSWFDAPPEGFSLTLSPFATMWNALFEWVTSSSLAFIYGGDESSHEDYLFVNGREYPRKIVLEGGCSSEIKQTIAGCLSRASPGLVADLRLSIPISTLEKAMDHMLNTMSFVYAVPGLRMKQWQVIALLFVEALSVSRLPALSLHASDRRVVLHKVLDGAQIQVEEYAIMKDFVLPLGRAPQFSAQSGA